MPARKRRPARPASAPTTRAASRLRRWLAAGRALDRCDPRRFAALTAIAEELVRAHRQAPDLAAEVRARFAHADTGRPRTPRDWGAAAIAAAERAGLERADIRSLRTSLRDQLAIDEASEDPKAGRAKPRGAL